MSKQNQLSRYGAISRAIPELAPSAKVFLVGDSDDTSYGVANLANDFPPDDDGVVRVYTTIQAAVNACAAGRGDIVLVAPNHTEDFQRADSWNVAGVQIIGMGYGDRRPGLVYNSASATVSLGADGVRVKNLNFMASADSIVRAVSMDTGFFGQAIEGCLFNIDAATDDFRVMIRAGSKESVIEGNRFIARDTGAASGRAISLKGGDPDHLLVRDNYFYGQYDTIGDTTDGAGVIVQDTTDTSDTNLSGLIIQNNLVVNTDTAAAMMLRLNGGGYRTNGIASDNRFANFDSSSADTAKFVTGNGVGTGIRFINNLMNSDSSTVHNVSDTSIAA